MADLAADPAERLFLFFPAVFVSSWLGGRVGAWVTAVLSTLAVWLFFVLPLYSVNEQSFDTLFPAAVLLATAVVFGEFHQRQRALHRSTEDALQAARTAVDDLNRAQAVANTGS